MTYKLARRIFVFLIILVIELPSLAVPYVQAQEANPIIQIDTPQPQAAEDLETLVAKAKIDKTNFDTPLPLADKPAISLPDAKSANSSARQPRPFALREWAHKDLKANEGAMIVVDNPENQSLSAKVKDQEGNTLDIAPSITAAPNTTKISISPPRNFKPGKYRLVIEDTAGNKVEQDFTWGVLAINTDKSIYLPGETADIALAVLDELGNMVCDAEVELEVTKPDGGFDILTTKNGDIIINPECRSHDFTLKPDYATKYLVGDEGVYALSLTARTKNGSYSINDSFESRASVPFDVKRTTATRIYPPNTYPVIMDITANQDFTGTITETVPGNFHITALTGESIISPGNQDIQEKPAEEPAKIAAVLGDQTSASESASPEATDSAVMAAGTGENGSENTQSLLGNFIGALVPRLNLPFSGSFPISLRFSEHLIDPYQRDLYRSFGMVGHDGIDFAMPIGTQIMAADDGEVILAGQGDYGTTIVIQHSWGRSYYGHLSKTLVVKGDKVSKADRIALSGNTGITTGPHLHFGIKPDSNDKQNGYYGKIDPAVFLGIDSNTTLALAPFVPSVLGAATIRIPEAPVQNLEPKNLTWKVTLAKGEKIKLGYNYLAPRISPQLYTIGPLAFTDESNAEVFKEIRTWSIAADAITQQDYRWYQNTNSLTPTKALQESNTPAIIAKNRPYVRLRTNLLSSAAINAGTASFKLQYASSSAVSATDWCSDNLGTPTICNTDWPYRRKIELNNTASATNITNFPVMIKLKQSSGNIDFSKTQNNGQDIRFVDASDPSTVIPHEIEKWDEAGDEAIVWVKVPQINAGSTPGNINADYIYMYYGNPSIGDGQQATSVWDDGGGGNFKGVWHLKENMSATCNAGFEVCDSTGNGNHGDETGSVASVTGQIGDGGGFTTNSDGTTSFDYLNMGNAATLNSISAALTVDAWVRVSTITAEGDVFSNDRDIGSGYKGYSLAVVTSGYARFAVWDGTNIHAINSGSTLTTNTWYHLTGTFNGTTVAIYVNGALSNSASWTGSIGVPASFNSRIGAMGYGTGQYDFVGSIDELRVSNTARSADWVEAEYLNTVTNSTYTVFNTEEGQSTLAWTDVGGNAGTSDWCADNTGTPLICNSSWTSRRKIEFNNTASAENLTDFPVLIKLTGGVNIDYSKTQNSGQDIRFVDPDNPGVTLAHEIDVWNESGSSFVWVKVPQIDAGSNPGSGADYIWMYYNNASIGDGQQATSVWSNGYEGVWHMNDLTGTTIKDSTGKSADGVKNGVGQPTQVTGLIGNAQNFAGTGTGDHINVADGAHLDFGAGVEFTTTVWVNQDLISSPYDAVYSKGGLNSVGDPGYCMELAGNTTTQAQDWLVSYADGSNGRFPRTGNGGMDTWVHMAAVYDYTVDPTNDYIRPYVNAAAASLNSSNIITGYGSAANAKVLTIGSSNNVGGNILDGMVDELRIARARRSPDWIEAEYLTSKSSSTFSSYGTEETYTPGQSGGVTWGFYDNTCGSCTDDATIPTTVLSGSTSRESYQENNPANLPTTLSATDTGEWDFSLDGTNAERTTYFFRMVYSDGSLLNGYTNYPTITVGPPLSMLMRHGKWYTYNEEQPFTF